MKRVRGKPGPKPRDPAIRVGLDLLKKLGPLSNSQRWRVLKAAATCYGIRIY